MILCQIAHIATIQAERKKGGYSLALRPFWERIISLTFSKSSYLEFSPRTARTCKDGQESYDDSKLTSVECKCFSDAEHKRNYGACLTGYGYCGLSRLSTEEARSHTTERQLSGQERDWVLKDLRCDPRFENNPTGQ